MLKKAASFVLSRSDHSMYLSVRLAVFAPCGLADDLFEHAAINGM
jgi:hypothetical protein